MLRYLHCVLFHTYSDVQCGDYLFFLLRLPSSNSKFVLQFSNGLLADIVCGSAVSLLDTLKERAYKIFLGYTVFFITIKLCTLFAGK